MGSRINSAMRYFLRLIIYVTVGGAFLMIPIFFYFLVKTNQELGTKFEDRSWAIPARVYARPLELYVDKPLKKEDLLLELELLSYKKNNQLSLSGTYREAEKTIDIFVREFIYSDEEAPAHKISVAINKNKITELKSVDSDESIALTRIEPLHIASIYPAHNEDRILLKREEVPPLLVDTLLAMEDRQFYSHMGINPKAILRAAIINFTTGSKSQGGSTLTQQLVKNYFLSPDPTYERKIREMFYALIIDWRYPKDDVLEAYINEIYLSQDGSRAIHGFGLASEFFFGKPVSELSINDIATLVGVIPAPGAYNPRSNPKKVLERRNLVLDVMASQNLLSREDVAKLKEEPLDILESPPRGITKYPGFIDLVTKQLKQFYTAEDLTHGGLKVFTTLDPVVQTYAEKAVIETLPVVESTRKVKDLQAAIIIAQNNTGEIEALVGDRQIRQAGFNRAINAKRQIGSLFKPFIYVRALEEPSRFSLATLLDDQTPFELHQAGSKVWTPRNYDRRLHGWIPLITSLTKSYNIPTIRLGMDVGVKNVIDSLYRLGLNEKEYHFPAVPSSLLGAIDITVFDVTQMYSTFANNGFYTPLSSIREVTREDGSTLIQNTIAPRRVIEPGPNYLITYAMENVINAGTGGGIRRAGITTKMAGKTGTTNDYRDSWFAGFTGDRVAVAWIGKDDNQSIGGRVGGAVGGLPLWAAAMKNLILEDINIPAPSNIMNVQINMSTGLPPPNYVCPGNITVRTLPFIRGYQPVYPGDCDFYPPEEEIEFIDDYSIPFSFESFYPQ